MKKEIEQMRSTLNQIKSRLEQIAKEREIEQKSKGSLFESTVEGIEFHDDNWNIEQSIYHLDFVEASISQLSFFDNERNLKP